jgi:hypothetical protein
MSRSSVDPAFLLIAVIAVGINPLTSPGHCGVTNTLLGAVVSLVVLLYAWPRNEDKVDVAHFLAVSLVLAIVFSTVFAWPIQELIFMPTGPRPTDDPAIDRISAEATYWGLALGFVLAALVFVFFWRRRWGGQGCTIMQPAAPRVAP